MTFPTFKQGDALRNACKYLTSSLSLTGLTIYRILNIPTNSLRHISMLCGNFPVLRRSSS